MAVKATVTPVQRYFGSDTIRDRIRRRIETVPWWLVAMVVMGIAAAFTIANQPNYRDAFDFIKTGLWITITTTLFAFALALVLGLLTGLMRISHSIVLKNMGTFYVEVVRGIPMLVLIFFIALVAVPSVVDSFNALGKYLQSIGWGFIGTWMSSIETNSVSMNLRAVVALSVTYGAFLAEIFRAGIQSIGRGQMEAARSQGMSYWQAMRYVILPQAVRNVLPALGNDFVSMLKDSSLVSVLAVRDVTQIARLYAGRSFQFREAYTTLAVLYLTMTVLLSFLVKYLEKRYQQNERA
jgi:polar amino acid transport system permease protein